MIKAIFYLGNISFLGHDEETVILINEIIKFFDENKVDLVVTPVIGWEVDLSTFAVNHISEDAQEFLESQENFRVKKIAIYNGYLDIELDGI